MDSPVNLYPGTGHAGGDASVYNWRLLDVRNTGLLRAAIGPDGDLALQHFTVGDAAQCILVPAAALPILLRLMGTVPYPPQALPESCELLQAVQYALRSLHMFGRRDSPGFALGAPDIDKLQQASDRLAKALAQRGITVCASPAQGTHEEVPHG